MNTHFITVPNNTEGQTFVQSLRKFLKGTPKKVSVRGRGYRHGVTKYRQDLPIHLSERLAVYIGNRPTYRYKLVSKTVTEWVRVPTKWGK